MTDFRVLLSALVDGGVRFVLVGGAAATAHGSARLTQDIAVVYARDDENLERVAAALAPHFPKLRGASPDLPFRLDPPTLRAGLNFTLATRLGDLDLLGELSGGWNYERLAAGAIRIRPFGVECLCAGIEDLIASKRAAGRPKDLEAIAELEAIREETGGPGSGTA